MREVQQVGHGDKRVVQGLHGSDPFVGVKSQHLLQQVDELTPVSLLCQNVCSLQVSHVHLQGEQRGANKGNLLFVLLSTESLLSGHVCERIKY